MTASHLGNVFKTTLAVAAVCLAARGPAQDGEQGSVTLERLSDSVVDDSALNFSQGPFGTCINGQTFQQEALVSFRSWQYAAYFADGGVLCLARRPLPKRNWERIRFDDYTIRHHDVHNVAVLGISAEDGTIHLAFDHHASALHYRRSIPGLASRPQDFKWQASLFGSTTSELEPGKPLQRVTYPQFFATPRGKLQLAFRLGVSGNGDWHLAEYDPQAGGWHALGRLFSKEGRFQTSSSRCAYPNQFRYDRNARLHATWCWRESPTDFPLGLTATHGLHYAYSDDCGRTWKNNLGQTVAALAGEEGENGSIDIDSPGTKAWDVRYHWGLMNTTTEFVDYASRPHVINWQLPLDAPGPSLDLNAWRYFHYWRDAEGEWHENRLPFYGRKPQILLDTAGHACVVFLSGAELNYHGSDPGGRLKIATASEASAWTDWKIVHEAEEHFVGEPLVDPARWAEEQTLSVYIQDYPAQPGRPSALRVIDFRASPP